MSAAVYGASEGLRTVLIERYTLGGQAGLARLGLDYATAGGLSATGVWFGGWLLGGLLAGWFLSTTLQRP